MKLSRWIIPLVALAIASCEEGVDGGVSDGDLHVRFRGESYPIYLDELEMDVIRMTQVVAFKTMFEEIGIQVADMDEMEFSLVTEEGLQMPDTGKTYPVSAIYAHLGGVSPLDHGCYWEQEDDTLNLPDQLDAEEAAYVNLMDIIQVTLAGETAAVPLNGVSSTGGIDIAGLDDEKRYISLARVLNESGMGGISDESGIEFSNHAGQGPGDDQACSEIYPVSGALRSQGWIDPSTHDLKWIIEGGSPECLNIEGLSRIAIIPP